MAKPVNFFSTTTARTTTFFNQLSFEGDNDILAVSVALNLLRAAHSIYCYKNTSNLKEATLHYNNAIKHSINPLLIIGCMAATSNPVTNLILYLAAFGLKNVAVDAIIPSNNQLLSDTAGKAIFGFIINSAIVLALASNPYWAIVPTLEFLAQEYLLLSRSDNLISDHAGFIPIVATFFGLLAFTEASILTTALFFLIAPIAARLTQAITDWAMDEEPSVSFSLQLT